MVAMQNKEGRTPESENAFTLPAGGGTSIGVQVVIHHAVYVRVLAAVEGMKMATSAQSPALGASVAAASRPIAVLTAVTFVQMSRVDVTFSGDATLPHGPPIGY